MSVTKPITFHSDGDDISASFVSGMQPDSISTLFLHGAGKSTKERAMPIANRLARDFGISSMLFDFSGHGQSTGELAASSLERRFQQAKDAIVAGGLQTPLTICAFSMGGPVGVELADIGLVRNLVLFYPAAYAQDAFELPFGDRRFTEVLHRTESWRESSAFSIMKRFEGNLLVVAGENDEVIPKDIPKMLVDSALRANSRELLLVPGAPHLLIPFILASDELFSLICSKIAQLVDDIGK